MICREDKADRLLADLAARRTGLVLSDSPVGTAIQVAGFNHLLGESGVSFVATADLAARVTPGPVTAVDPAARTFVLRGQAVSDAGNVAYSGGTSSNLVVGADVFVRGSLAADGSSVQAASIAFTPGG